MRLGIRLQIVLALSGLLLLAFAPLFVAVANLTRATLYAEREASARMLSRAVAAHVAEVLSQRTKEELAALLDAEVGTEGVTAIGVYDEEGRPVIRAGQEGAADALPAHTANAEESAEVVRTERGAAIQVVVPGPKGAVATLLRFNEDGGRGAPLVRLVGLYTALVALALLIFAYIALTRLIVRPLDALTAAARRVAGGSGRSLEGALDRGPAELTDLGSSLAEMTAKLRADEERMREQIVLLERRATELREAQDRLMRSERLASVGRLAAGLAHELGNPIAALLGLEALLLQGGLEKSEERDFLVRIQAETERIHRILRDLLDFARPAASLPPSGLRDPPGQVDGAIADVVALVRPQRSFRNVEVATKVSTALLPVRLGRERIMQVLLNLLLNAADATGERGHIRIAAEPGEGTVRVRVEDDGPGIDVSIRGRLFEPFVTTKEIGKGTGLGLAVCQGLVEAAGGTIRLDESFHPGACFVIELPIAPE